jgi:hypothetical protein
MHLRLQLETVNVALSHGALPGVGLAAWLIELSAPRVWAQLPAPVQAHVLLNLSAALRALPSAAQEQLLRRVRDTCTLTGTHAAALQCAACIGAGAAVRALFAAEAATPAAGASGGASKRLREAMLALLSELAQASLPPPAGWAAPSVVLSSPPADVRWRLVCATHGWDQHEAPPEAAVQERLVAACQDAQLEIADNAAKAALLDLGAMASSAAVVQLPAPPSEYELRHWAWHALAAAHSAVPAKASLSALADILQLSSAQGDSAHPASTWQPPGGRAGDAAAKTAEHGSLDWLRVATLAALRASLSPLASETQLKRMVTCLANISPARGPAAFEPPWRAACCASASAVAACSTECQQDVLLELLRTLWAQQREDVSASTLDQSASQGHVLLWLAQLAYFAVMVWELGKRSQDGAVTPQSGVPWHCDAPDDAALLQQADTAQATAQSTLVGLVGPAWGRLVGLLPQALKRLLDTQDWAGARPEMLRVLCEVWHLVQSERSPPQVVTALAHTLVCFWLDLQQQERGALLKHVSVDFGTGGSSSAEA